VGWRLQLKWMHQEGRQGQARRTLAALAAGLAREVRQLPSSEMSSSAAIKASRCEKPTELGQRCSWPPGPARSRTFTFLRAVLLAGDLQLSLLILPI
jgi:hypothetical protein